MALVPIDSTNFTVGTNAVSTVTFGPGFRGLKVQSLNGGGTVGSRRRRPEGRRSVGSRSALGGN